jgi:hypothetical protein
MSAPTDSHNPGNAAWQALATSQPDDPPPRTRQRSPEARMLEVEVRRLLERLAAPDIEGIWLDFRGREAVWVASPVFDGTDPET